MVGALGLVDGAQRAIVALRHSRGSPATAAPPSHQTGDADFAESVAEKIPGEGRPKERCGGGDAEDAENGDTANEPRSLRKGDEYPDDKAAGAKLGPEFLSVQLPTLVDQLHRRLPRCGANRSEKSIQLKHEVVAT